MTIDLLTLYYMAALITLTAGVVSIVFSQTTSQAHSVLHWGLATLFIAAGLLLIVFRAWLPFSLGVLLANILLVTGMVLTYRSFRLYRGETGSDVIGIALILLTTAVTSLLWTETAGPGPYDAVVTASLAIIMWRCAWLLWFRATDESRRSQRFTALNYMAFASLNTFRTMVALTKHADHMVVQDWVELIFISGNAVLWVGVTMGVMWMVAERQQTQLARMAFKDPLTGALNRQALSEAFVRETTRARRREEPVGVVILDIDRFKRFNDTYGHLVGDRVLKELVVTMNEVTRAEDAVGRYGGEEFLIIMPGADLTKSRDATERIRIAVERRGVMVNGEFVSLTVSAGIAVFPDDGDSWEVLVEKADEAMYRAKEAGRNRVVAFRDSQ